VLVYIMLHSVRHMGKKIASLFVKARPIFLHKLIGSKTLLIVQIKFCSPVINFGTHVS